MELWGRTVALENLSQASCSGAQLCSNNLIIAGEGERKIEFTRRLCSLLYWMLLSIVWYHKK